MCACAVSQRGSFEHLLLHHSHLHDSNRSLPVMPSIAFFCPSEGKLNY